MADAVAIGLSSMLGAGVFAGLAPAAEAAGPSLLLSVFLAAGMAHLSASAATRVPPTADGNYGFVRTWLGDGPGFLAGWSLLLGRVAAAAVLALTFAAYLVPEPGLWHRLLAVAAVVAVAAANCRRTQPSRWPAWLATGAALICLGGVATLSWPGSGAGLPAVSGLVWTDDWAGVLRSTGLLFFAFTGFARITTPRHRSSDPLRAIRIALGISVTVYAAIAVAALTALGADGLARSSAPLLAVLQVAGADGWQPAVRLAAMLTCLGGLLTLLGGLGRTAAAMGRTGDLPDWLGAIHPRFGTNEHAELAVAAAAAVTVLMTDLANAIGFAAFALLLHGAILSAAAQRWSLARREPANLVNLAALVASLGLAVALPWQSVLSGILVLAVGMLVHLAALRGRPQPA